MRAIHYWALAQKSLRKADLENDHAGDLSSASPAQDPPTIVSRPSSPPQDIQNGQAKSWVSRQRSKTRKKEELNLEREKTEILKQVAANNSVGDNEDSDDIFGKQVACKIHLIKDPVEKMQARRSITRILYDAQDRSMFQQMTAYS